MPSDAPPTLAARLSALYEERANLKERIAALGRDTAARAEQGPGNPLNPRQFMERIASSMADFETLKGELDWTERQIVAILGNPALGYREAIYGS